AKYYVPSGRCIQSVRYKNGEPVDIPENERAQFRTRRGRIVLDGGGIKPDVALPYDTASTLVKALLEQNVIFDFVTDFALKTPKIDSIELFEYTDFAAFEQFARSRNFTYETNSEKKLKELRTFSANEGLNLNNEIAALEARIKQEKQNEMTRNRDRILYEIEQDIVGRYHFEKGKVRKRLVNDPEVKEAVKLLNDPVRYQKILGGA
ncbi:MAG: S41 family peptidase, partial [Saprospiraceae bacterium]|nr:S41 family peptidase [Saprospiraceae bacterium]